MLIEHVQGTRNGIQSWTTSLGSWPCHSLFLHRPWEGRQQETHSGLDSVGWACASSVVSHFLQGERKVFRHGHPGQSRCCLLCGLWESSVSLSIFSLASNHLPSSLGLYIPTKPLTAVLTSCFSSLCWKGWKAPQNRGHGEITLIKIQSP